MSNIVKILSIDGGGIRGLIPALVLAEIEKRTQKPISSLFDLVAGSSTGGILSLGLVKPDAAGNPQYTAQEFAKLYESEGNNVFPEKFKQLSFLVKYIKKSGLLGDKYPAYFINKVFEKYFGETTLKEALTEVLLTSYEIEKRQTYFFKRHKAIEHDNHNFLMKHAAYATSAAPTYFDPLKIKVNDSSECLTLIDGGVYVNNPSLCALIEAKKIFPKAEEFIVVSMGTGIPSYKLSYDKVKSWNKANWARPVINIANHGISETVHHQLQHLLPDQDSQKYYYRFQVQLDENTEKIDNSSEENLANLKQLAKDLISENNETIDNLCKLLV